MKYGPQHWIEELTPTSRRAFALGISLALTVLGLTIASGWLLARSLVRQQFVQREAEALHATTLMEQLDGGSRNDGDLLESDEQVGFDAAVRASRLKGVMGIRFFDRSGRFRDAFPGTIEPRELSREALSAIHRLRPHGEFAANTLLSDVFIYLPQFGTGRIPRVPTLRVTVPLHHRDSTNLVGAAQFIVEGETMALEYGRLDRHLGGLAAAAFGVSGLLLAAMLWPVFRQVERLNYELAARNERLSRANEELAFAARASALGAVSAHLMHGLRNPLASLSQFLNGQGRRKGEPGDEEVQDALTAARRMQLLVEQTLEVLADARGEPVYEMRLGELLEGVRQRVAGLTARSGVEFSLAATGEPTLSSRTANLLQLILVNLVENAVQVTSAGGSVVLSAKCETDRLRVSVQDQGPGLPEHLRSSLFLPCRSTRNGGSGLGLAISKRLAEHLGASLELEKSSECGCVFVVELPCEALETATALHGQEPGEGARGEVSGGGC